MPPKTAPEIASAYSSHRKRLSLLNVSIKTRDREPDAFYPYSAAVRSTAGSPRAAES